MERIAGLYVAPTEPVALKKLGKSSIMPERFGVDVLWAAKGVKIGVQRKRWDDLIASVEDGRWAREIPMMTGRLGEAWVVVEGWPKVGSDGQIIDRGFGRAWTEGMMWGVLWAARKEGVKVDRVGDIAGMCRWVRGHVAWSKKTRHSSAATRPGPTGMWGHRSDRDWGVHLLQGLDGVGVELAGRIWDRFGKVPWAWEVGVDELCEVDGIGKKKAEKMLRALGGKDE